MASGNTKIIMKNFDPAVDRQTTLDCAHTSVTFLFRFHIFIFECTLILVCL